MKKMTGAKRLISLLLLLTMVMGLIPMDVLGAQVRTPAATRDSSVTKAAETGTAQTRGYFDVADAIPDSDGCFSMQGMAVLGDYVYTVKRNAAEDKAVIFRTHRLNGTTEQMNFDGAMSVNYLGHANDMCAAQVGADSYLFVTTMKTSTDALVCFKISGTKLSLVDILDVRTSGGSNITCSGLDVYEVNGTVVTLLVGHGSLIFLGTLDVTAPADLYCPLGFEIDTANMLQVAREACGFSELEMTIQGAAYYNDTYYMPLTLHHNHETQIKADNHSDSTSVIVAFPNIRDAIKVMNRSVKASLADTIYVPDAGEMFFEIESLGFANGVMYFNTNRVRIDNSCTSISVLLDPDVNMDDFLRRASFRQDGIYRLSGASATNYFLYDPGDGTPITAGVYGDIINTRFGLESNEEGFYYIRSMLTKEYLTVNADCTVTTGAKKENDPSQLFCLTQINWPNEPGHVAIISMLNYQYLNNEVDTTELITTTGGKTYRLNKVKYISALENYLFDLQLYNACYPETVGMTRSEGIAHFKSTGLAEGRIASVFFDPVYYMENNPDLGLQTYQEAYDHFLNYGFWDGRQGSLFFSCNEYLHSGDYNLRDGDYPDKYFYLKHFREYGANESLTRSDRYGSDEFAVQEVVAKFALTPSTGYDFLVEYISRNVRADSIHNAEVQSQDDLKAMLFDWKYYSSKYPAALSEEKVAGFPGTTYAEKLHSHWLQYGITEGRTASPYFNAAFYRTQYTDVPATNAGAYEHFVTTGFWEGRAGSAFYDGESYLYGTNPEKALLCDHMLTVTATIESTCTSNGTQTTYCCECSAIVKTANLPAKEHKDEDSDSYCDVCDIVLSGSTLIKSDIDTMVDPAPTNEYYDLSGKTFDNNEVEGTYYMVQHNSDGVYRIFDTLNQSGRGSFPATAVTVKNNAVYGAHPDMAITLNFVEAGANQDGIWYIGMNDDYWLSYGANASATNYTVGEARRMVNPGRLALRMVTELGPDIFRIYRRIDSKDHWLNMLEKDGFYYYRFTTNVTPDADNTFYLYKLLTDRLHTEDMYATIKDARALADPSPLYDSVSYDKFLVCVRECIALYEKYNGTVLTGSDLTNREALQEAFDAKERELINLMGLLRINAEGKTIRYFPANMYNYNEDNMNALVNVMTGADTAGFFFESGNNKNTTAFYSVYDSATEELVKERTIRSQMYSITSGIAASDLSTAVNPPFANSVVTADFWSNAPIENAKEVYTDVGVPFTYEDGYYVLNSDSNAVFFEGTPKSGANLAISERPAAYYWSGGMTHGVAKQGFNANDYTTFHYADGYVTGFQPFAKMTYRHAEAYTAAASVFEETELVDSYLLGGVAFDSATNPTLAVSGSGTAVWGFGMKLDIDFMMTDDGRLLDENRTPITFEFSGDDDVWVYIDGKLVLDIGGSHDAIQGVIDFTNGNVVVRSDKYDRIRDKNTSGYGRSDAAKYDPEHLSSDHSIVTNQMYQKNIYAEVFNQTVEQFANDGENHTLTVYYMDRGKGRTNSMIKFNLPQTDTLTVNKDVKCATYENGVLTQMAAEESAGLMSALSAMSFEYTLTDNGKAMANQSYRLLQNGVDMGEKTTDASGKFSLKHGQSAVFSGLNFTASNKYKVVETTPTNTWFNVEWSHTTSGSASPSVSTPAISASTYNENTSSTIAIDGDLYANETITFNCTNTFVQVVSEADEVIVDYGKTMQIDILQNDPSLLFLNGYVRQLQGFADYTENLNLITSLKTAGAENYTTESGNFSIANGEVQFTPKKLLDTVDRLYCVVKYSKGTDFFYLYEELRVVPSDVMYYETDFAGGVFQTEGERDFVFLDFGPDDTTTWTYTQNTDVTKDTENGILKGNITGGDPFVGMRNGTKQLHYVTKPGDVVIMRMKTTRTSEGGNSRGYEVFLSFTDTTASHGWEGIRDEQHEQGTGKYEILTLVLPEDKIGRTLEEFRFDPFWNADGNKVLGNYELDYVYIGQPATAPAENYLFFDFDNGMDDQFRYKQEQYGSVNFDQGNWVLGNALYSTAYTIDHDAGTLSLKLSSDATYDGPYLSVTNGLTNNFPWSTIYDCGILNFDASEIEVLKVRFKLVNCTKRTDADTRALLLTHYTRNGENVYYGGIGQNTAYTYQEDEWITVTANIGYRFQAGDVMDTVGIWFDNLTTEKDGEIIIDYIYVGKEADFNKVLIYDRSVKKNVTGNSAANNYLLFDFDNQADDQLRYEKAQYGGVNFDQGNWVLGTGAHAKAYEIDHEAGTLTAQLSTNTSHDGLYISLTNGLTENFPWSTNKTCGVLNFDASDVEVLKVRFKLINCVKKTDGETKAMFLTHIKRNGADVYYGDIGTDAAYTYQTDEWITVTAKVGYKIQNGDVMNTIGVWFNNLQLDGDGKIVIDYIYVGKEAAFNRAMMYDGGAWQLSLDETAKESSPDTEGNLFFDFTNDAEDQIRYAQPQYGGKGINYDTSYWNLRTYTMDNLKYHNNTGVLHGVAIKDQAADKKYSYYFQVSQGINEGYNLQYDPSNAEVIYVRAKLENFTAHGSPRVEVNYYTSADKSGTLYSVNEKFNIDPILLETEEYFVVRISAEDLQQHEIITALRINFANIDNSMTEAGRIYLDYVYVGTEAGYRTAMLHSRGETNPDGPQDSGLTNDDAYLLLDFNEGDKTVWNNLNGTTVTKDTASGVLRGKLSTNGTADNWFGMRSDSRQVNYTFKKGDVFQVRIKVNLDDPSLKRTGFQFYFTNSYDGKYYEYKDNYYDHITGEYSVVTMTVPEHFWGMNVVNFRLDPFLGQATGTYELDYVYIGQPKQAPGFSAGQKDFILFTFDGDDLAQARSRQSVYGGFNGENDPWSTNTSRNTELYPGNDEGTKAFTATKGNTERYHYIRSSADGVYGYSLNHTPSINDVLQVRVKFESFKVGNTNPYITMSYYSKENIFNDQGKDAGVTVSHHYFDPAYLNSGEYVTLTVPVNAAYAAAEKITTFCVFFNEMISISDTQLGKVTIDYIYLGAEGSAPSEGKMVLGYDSSYEDDSHYSNGSSLYTEGIGVPNLNADKTVKESSYNGASFTFTGTGFDILSRTGTQQGALRIMIYDADGSFVRAASVINKSDKNLELYQIPVYSVNNLPYGTYTARIFVNAAYDYGNDGNADIFGGSLDRGAEFYFDAVRIYNPIDTSAAARASSESSRLAYDAYLSVSEADQKQTEVRQFILDKGNFKGDGTVDGILYLDNTDHKIDIGTYEKIGPNNETYLAANQGIAFKLVVEGMVPDSIDLSAKTADGKSAMMRISASKTPPSSFETGQLVGITSATLQNYSVKIPAAAWTTSGNSSYTYVTVYNADSGILSIADIKCAYDSVKVTGALRSIRFLVDAEMVEAMLPSPEPTEDANLTFGAQLSLDNDLTMKFRVKTDKLSAYDLSTAYLVVERDVYETGAAEATVETMTISEYTIEDGRLIFEYPGIAAAQMNDGIRATLYIKDAGGKEYVSPVLNTSVATYLDGLLSVSASDAKLVTLIMDMVNYGAAAQIYFDRHADAPVNEAFESFKTYASYASADFTTALENLSTTEGAEGKDGKLNLGLDLGTRIGIQYKVTLPNGIAAEDATLVITDASGNELETIEIASGKVDDRGRYIVNFYGATARDMRRVVYATAHANGEAITGTYSYSISTYAWGVQENASQQPAELVNVTRAMMLYGDSAAAYFG